ncbi:hypothetical protein E2F50_22400 [Rhizobium deserti]|uniref:Uncharacterized protein n=1 Tax=Rhizobium deserti TaxID=2547961 RepID=A0A4R5U697_9HYPH|nr:hypothetical protein [Rhizobium deserti]TDK29594.1 hypothetical protein E2F50_22400 [Rhizobium deserti]
MRPRNENPSGPTKVRRDDWRKQTVEQFYSKPAVWRKDADPATVRAKTLALRPRIEARLRQRLAVKFSEDELQAVLKDVAATGKINFTKEGMLYALNFEFDSAISDFVLPMIGW